VTLGGLDDAVAGGAGNDTLSGKAGNDTLDGGAGTDLLVGGTGDDLYMVGDAGDRVVELNGEGTDLVQASVSFSLAGQYIEKLMLTGTAAINATGNSLDNTLTGNAAANLLSGGIGNDTLSGADGSDTLTGGTGADTFAYQAPSESTAALMDVITGFSHVESDRIDLSAIDAQPGTAGDQAFVWNGTGAFSGGGIGSIRYRQVGGDTFVEVDTSDGTADMVIKLTGLVSLASTDFIL
jgi:Ca2+-binding RTX toxin-like protein